MQTQQMVERLEEFFQSEVVQERLSRFMHAEARVNTVFEETNVNLEQKLQYTSVHNAYCEMVEKMLASFQEAYNCSVDEVLRVLVDLDLAAMHDTHVCAPYLAGSLDYKPFVNLVAQWKDSYSGNEISA